MDSRLFIGIFPGGISYCDRSVEEDGDYKRLAFLPYDGMVLQIEEDCPPELAAEISADAKRYDKMTSLQISQTGQSVELRHDLSKSKPQMKM